MAKLKFYLDSKQDKQGNSLIFISFCYDGNRLRYSTGQSLNQKEWSKPDNRARRTFLGYKTLNSLLDKLESHLKDVYRIAQTDGEMITNHYLKKAMDIFLIRVNSNGQALDKKTLEDYFNEYLIEKSRPGKDQLTRVSVMKYQNIMNIMKKFTTLYKIPLTFQAMNEEYVISYLEYRASLMKSNETVSKEITSWKTFLIWSFKKGYIENNRFVNWFRGFDQEKPVVCMTKEELFQLYEFDFSPNRDWQRILEGLKDKYGKQITYSESWEDIRNVFCFCSFTSLRFSDYFGMSKANIQGDYIVITIKKTKQALRIVINKYARQILEKYNYELPKFSNPYSNRELKNIGQAAGLNQERIVTKFIGKDRFDETLPMSALLKFHVSRKNFISQSLERGLRPEQIMVMSGHKKHSTMRKYISVNDKTLKEDTLKAWS